MKLCYISYLCIVCDLRLIHLEFLFTRVNAWQCTFVLDLEECMGVREVKPLFESSDEHVGTR